MMHTVTPRRGGMPYLEKSKSASDLDRVECFGLEVDFAAGSYGAFKGR